jgi:hypothetical protein
MMYGKMSTKPHLIIDRKLKKDTLILESSGKVKAFASSANDAGAVDKSWSLGCD